jgi:hypothetical protein
MNGSRRWQQYTAVSVDIAVSFGITVASVGIAVSALSERKYI